MVSLSEGICSFLYFGRNGSFIIESRLFESRRCVVTSRWRSWLSYEITELVASQVVVNAKALDRYSGSVWMPFVAVPVISAHDRDLLFDK